MSLSGRIFSKKNKSEENKQQSKTKIYYKMSQVDIEPKIEINSPEEIPDDFFDELAETDFIEEIIDQEINETAIDNNNENADANDHEIDDGDAKKPESSPRMARCLAEIKTLTKDIERRKQKLERELFDKGYSEGQLRREVSDSQTREREKRRDRVRETDKGRNKDRKSRSRSRSRDRYRSNRSHRSHRSHRSRSRSPIDRRYGRRNRSKSPKRSSSTHKNLTFLEELAQTFAEQGQAFPEKDLILNQQNQNLPINLNHQPLHQMETNLMPIGMNLQPPLPGPSYLSGMGPSLNQPVAYPTINYPPNAYYGPGQNVMEPPPHIPPTNPVSDENFFFFFLF